MTEPAALNIPEPDDNTPVVIEAEDGALSAFRRDDSRADEHRDVLRDLGMDLSEEHRWYARDWNPDLPRAWEAITDGAVEVYALSPYPRSEGGGEG